MFICVRAVGAGEHWFENLVFCWLFGGKRMKQLRTAGHPSPRTRSTTFIQAVRCGHMASYPEPTMKTKNDLARLCVWFWLLTILPLAHSTNFQTLCSFPAGPAYPYAGLVQGSDGNFYGTTQNGGTSGDNYGGYGTVFKVTTNGTLTTLVSFANINGANPQAGLVQGSDGNLYGTTQNGGTNDILYGGHGTVFRVATNGVLTSLYSFTGGGVGGPPQGDLIQGSDGNFYGTRNNGGSSGYGSVFMLATNGTFTTLASFANTNGANPYAGLVQGSDGNFYGTTVNGGDNGYGTVFQVTTNGTLTTLASFANTNGANPYAGLVQGSDGNFYGTTVSGGDNGNGTVFQVTTNGTLTTLVSFAGTNGANPYAGLVQGRDGNFYGTTESGGAYSNPQYYTNPWLNGYGTVFMVTTNGTLTTLHSFGAVTHDTGVPFDGGNPYGRLVQGGDGNFYGTANNGGSCGLGTVFMVTTNGTFTTLASFALNPDGANPYGGLVQGSDGTCYGTTVYGGMNGYHNDITGALISFGTVFKLTTNGILTALVSFAGTNGANPYGGLIQGSDGYFYGTTRNGGTNGGYGTVFKMTANGTLISLVSFGNTNGANPYAGLVQCSDGNYYGTTANGGSGGYGTVFMVTTNGTLTTLASFANTNGANPYSSLIQGSDGNFYGTTVNGGTNGGGGTVFMVTTNGMLTTLISLVKTFASGTTIWIFPDGGNPLGGLVQDREGNFYGTTEYGATTAYSSYGSVFQVSTNGAFTNLVSFANSNGAYPNAGLVQGSGGSFYGTTYQGGPQYFVRKPGIFQGYVSYGTVFQVTTNGTLTDLVLFANSNGANPYAGLIQDSDGNCLYGTTYSGGANADNYSDGYGTVFRIIFAPTIFSPPTNQTVAAGGNVTFSVGATGLAPLAYQWRKNGANIGGATNTSLFLSNVTVASAANYSVAVSNPGGTVVSSSATLAVVCPTITVSPAMLPTAMVGLAYVMTNTASGGVAPYTFARMNGVLPPGLTLSSNGVLSGTPTSTGNYSFTVRATDFDGCIGTNRYTLVVNVYPIFVNPYVDSNGWFHTPLKIPAGSNFIVFASTNVALLLSNWTPLTTNNAPSGIFDFTDTNGLGSTNNWPQRFYRALLLP